MSLLLLGAAWSTSRWMTISSWRSSVRASARHATVGIALFAMLSAADAIPRARYSAKLTAAMKLATVKTNEPMSSHTTRTERRVRSPVRDQLTVASPEDAGAGPRAPRGHAG